MGRETERERKRGGEERKENKEILLRTEGYIMNISEKKSYRATRDLYRAFSTCLLETCNQNSKLK